MTVQPIPEGYATITPYFAVDAAAELIEFLKAAFGAEIKGCSQKDGIIYNAELRIGTSMIMVADTRGRHPGTKAMMYLYVPDVDQAYARAIAAGAKSIMEPMDQFYGDRSGGVEDPSGNQWWVATHIRDVPADEITRLMAQQGGKG